MVVASVIFQNYKYKTPVLRYGITMIRLLNLRIRLYNTNHVNSLAKYQYNSSEFKHKLSKYYEIIKFRIQNTGGSFMYRY